MAITIPSRLRIGPGGKVLGHVQGGIGYSHPFPVPNGSPGQGSDAMLGVIMHTEVGYDHNVEIEFEDRKFAASAFFSVRDDGHITQYGPIGLNWMAWAQVAGNPMYYSIEHEDKGKPQVPLNQLQIQSSAQLVEFLSAFAGFPLILANQPGEKGFGTHFMGGAAWGGHSCPDVPPKPVRSLQRQPILDLAHQIRQSGILLRHVGDGSQTWGQLAAARHVTVEHLLTQALAHYTEADLADISKLPIESGLPYYLFG